MTTFNPDSPRSNQFQDKAGQSHAIELNYALLRPIKALGVDLGNLEELGAVWGKLLLDDDLALRVVWLALGRSGQPEEDWLATMDGGTLEAAREALLGALENFTPAKRQMIAAGAAKIHEQYKKAIAETVQRIEAITDETIQRAMKKLNQKPPGTRQPRSPASSAAGTTTGRSGKR